jgi:hypothetical protein
MIKTECGKCLGKGFIRAFGHVKRGVCFDCGGHGFKLTKNPIKPKFRYTVSIVTNCEECPLYYSGFDVRGGNKAGINKATRFFQSGKNKGLDYFVNADFSTIEIMEKMKWDGRYWEKVAI